MRNKYISHCRWVWGLELTLNLAGARGRRINSKPTLDLWLSWELRDVGGRVVRRGRPRRSHSFVAGFLTALTLSGSGCSAWTLQTGSGNTSSGILVGSGTTQPKVTDTGLTSLIGNGSGSGQLEYGNSDVLQPTVNSNTNQATIIIQRSFVNQSGGNVTVTETGIMAQEENHISGGLFQIFFAHDLFASAITVGNGQTLTVTYTVVMST